MSRIVRSSRSARRSGRPRQAAGEGLRDRLIDAALGLFSRQGVSGTSLQAVAREAGVTPAMLHYYFGNRDALLDVLVDERVLPVLGGMLARLSGVGTHPADWIRAMVPAIVEAAAAHPWLPPLWVHEVLRDGGSLRERVLPHARLLVPGAVAGLTAARDAGRLAPGLEPRLLPVSVIGLTLFPLAARPVWSRVLDAGDITPDDLVRHALALLLPSLEFHRE